MESKERYRKLPGRRRGLLFGSSVWQGSDHLLLVKSSRFREEYRRFYFRDIQAIVTANAWRIHISTRSLLIGMVWLCIMGVANSTEQTPFALRLIVNLGFLFLVFVWAYQSAKCSCRCRIYTAVSSEELTSVYRTWTARHFLEAVEPLVAQAQGVLDADWAEAVEERQIGPLAEGRVGLATPPSAVPTTQPSPPPTPSAMSARTPVSFLFVASLCLGGLAELLSLQASGNVGRWILNGFLLLQIAAAVAVLVQNYMGKLTPGLRNLAIAMMVWVGVWYVGAQAVGFVSVVSQRAAPGSTSVAMGQIDPLALLYYPWSRGVAGGMGLFLGLIGAALILRGDTQQEETVSFNV
jgi:hypothetical protein